MEGIAVTAAVTTGAKLLKDVAVAPTKKAGSSMWIPIKQMLFYSRKIKKVEMNIKLLLNRKEDIETRIKNERFEQKVVSEDAKRWLFDVETIWKRVKDLELECRGFKSEDTAQSPDILEEGGDKKAKLKAKGNIINPFQRRKVAAEAENILNEIERLENQRHSLALFVSSSIPRYGSRPEKEFKEYNSTREDLDKIMKTLEDDSTNIVGIYGTGGIGKSTILDQVGRRMEAQQIFDMVLAVDVLHNPCIDQIQDRIAEQLRMSFPAGSIYQRATDLSASLRQAGKVLLMLDNVWETLDLTHTGIPIRSVGNVGCKILIATRNIGVCHSMHADVLIQVNFLLKEDSLDLFKDRAGLQNGMSEIETVAEKVAEECGGLPLALDVIGTALRGKDKDNWRFALLQLSKSNPTDLDYVEEKLYKCLKLSYDCLQQDERKLLFLFCALFPEGYEINEDELTRYWIGENIYGDCNTLEEARQKTHMRMANLGECCLVLPTGKAKSVKLHNIMRDVAIYIASRDDNRFFVESDPCTGYIIEETFENFRRISIMNTGIGEVTGIKCSQVQLLLLRNNPHLLCLPINFFKNMQKLAVLDMSNSFIDSLPLSVQDLGALRTLCLNESKICRDIWVVGRLENLQVLCLRGCLFSSLPKELGEIQKLRLLDLSLMECLEIPSELVRKLRHLEELYIDSSKLTVDVLIEIFTLRRLSRLQLYAKDAMILSQDIVADSTDFFKKLKSYVLSTELHWISRAKLHEKNLYIKGVEIITSWVKTLLSQTEDCILDNCLNKESVPPHFFTLTGINTFENVKILRLTNCHTIDYIILSKEYDRHTVLNNLEELHLTKCSNLRAVCHLQSPKMGASVLPRLRTVRLSNLPGIISIWSWKGGVPPTFCSNLKELNVLHCNKLEYLFVVSIAAMLISLKKLTAVRNREMKEIIASDEKMNLVAVDNIGEGDSAGSICVDSPRIEQSAADEIVENSPENEEITPETVTGEFSEHDSRIEGDVAVEMADRNPRNTENIADKVFTREAFGGLIHLSLKQLPKLERFCSAGNEAIRFSWVSFQTLRLGNCPSLKEIPNGSESGSKIDLILEDSSDMARFQQLTSQDESLASRFRVILQEDGSS